MPVAIVVGGSGGVGRGVVRALSAAGAQVAVLDLMRNDEAFLSIECDATVDAVVGDAVARVEKALGPPDSLVCAAGVVSEAPLPQLSLTEWRRVLDVSLTSAFLAVRSVAPVMAEHGGGSIVTFSSGWARKGYPTGAHYAAAKAGVEALTKSVALEYAGRGVRVNCVAPGPIRTPMLADSASFDEAARASAIPMGRIGEVDDVVGPVLFLLSDEARYVTGQVLHVNGGMLMPG